MTTAAASAAASALPGVDGECGYQHGMAPCLPMNGLSCCSINGFCGSNETYCLTAFGCQYGCVEPSYFYSSSVVLLTSILTVPPNGTASATASPSITKAGNTTATTTNKAVSSTNTSSATAVAENHGLTKGAKAGVIAAAVIGVILILILVALIFLWNRRRRRLRREKAEAALTNAMSVADANEILRSEHDFGIVNNGEARARR